MIYNDNLPDNVYYANAPVDLLLNKKQAARYLGMSVSWLDGARLANTGPKFVKFDRAVRYRLGDLKEFVASLVVKTDCYNNITPYDPYAVDPNQRGIKRIRHRNEVARARALARHKQIEEMRARHAEIAESGADHG